MPLNICFRWGRVGEVGANQLHGPFSNLEDAVKNFEKKFLDKTRNNWANRDKFQAMAGKYALLEMGDEEEDEEEEETEEKTPKGKDAGKGAHVLDIRTIYIINFTFLIGSSKKNMSKSSICYL